MINEAEFVKGRILGGSHFRVLNPNFRKGKRKDHSPTTFRCNNNKSKHTILLFFLFIDQGEAQKRAIVDGSVHAQSIGGVRARKRV